MKSEKESEYCDVCDHRIVRGVACDGHPEECTYQDGQGKAAADRRFGYSDAVAEFFGTTEFDVIRGAD